jgi:hypothetical protein
MKIRKILRVLLTVSLFLVLAGCTKVEIIQIRGQVSLTIEVGTDYIEEGVIFPEKYTLIANGDVNTDRLGTYELTYSIYTDEGELVKKLNRFINVVDTQSPSYVESTSHIFYAGIDYSVDDFLESYSDNYDDILDLSIISNSDFRFNEIGYPNIEINISDTSNNETIYTNSIDVVLDFEKLIDYIYSNQYLLVSKGTTGIGSSYVKVRIDSNRSFTYFDSGSIHYVKSFSSNLGTGASIQISANYGEFSNAHLNYHINGSNGQYSVGFLSFNAINDYDSLTFSTFNNSINNLNLNENDMINEMNPKVLDTLNEFKNYVEITLGLKFK